MEKNKKTSDSIFSVMQLLYILIPLAALGSGLYFFFNGTDQKKIMKTQDDIIFIARNIRDTFLTRKYQSFDNTTIALSSNILPFDVEAKNTPRGYMIPNRFGGKMFFYEAFANINERTLYFATYNDPQKYSQVYKGSGAYILLLTNLKKGECITLAQIDWRRHIPNFLGLEASAVTPEKPYNGLYNLKTYLLVDNLGEKFNTKDEGLISRRPMSDETAQQACSCRWKNCMLALKFL